MSLLSPAESELSEEAMSLVRQRALEEQGRREREVEAATASPFAPRVFVVEGRTEIPDYLAGLIGKQ